MSSPYQDIEQQLIDAMADRPPPTHITLAVLSQIVTVRSSPEIAAASFFALQDAYDKGVKRDEFFRMLNDVLWLYDHMARLRYVTATQMLLGHNDLTPDKLEVTIKWLTTRAEGRRKWLVDQLERVSKIPPKGTSKH